MALALARTLRESARAESAALLRRAVSSATHLTTWIRENEKSFAPPIMNKLMHRDQLSIMFVGGPNRREDFHIEEGSEFFYQLRGNMELPVVQAGRRELVSIREGDVFLLPSRIPHSPQRPEAGSIGLVIERQRYEHEAPDGLRFYTDFATCERVLWERYFHCVDLGKDLAPIVAAFNDSEEKRTRTPTASSVLQPPPLAQDTTTVVPPPFNLDRWIERHSATLDGGVALPLFDNHPDREFDVRVVGGPGVQHEQRWQHETFLMQLRGDALIDLSLPSPAAATTTYSTERVPLPEGSCFIVPPKCTYTVHREAGSRGLVVINDPSGNKR